MSSFGYNPLRWNCDFSGCFNQLRRPKIEVFHDCFPGRINFGDVDGLVEINGYFCLLEWKCGSRQIPTGQRIKDERFTRSKGNVVFVAQGDAYEMIVYGYTIAWAGKYGKWIDGSLTDLKKRIADWAQWALKQPTRIA